MPVLRYEVLRPKTYVVRGETPNDVRKVTFTHSHAKSYAKRGNELIASGRDVPAIWEHRSDGEPRKLNRDEWATEQAKGTFGYVKNYEVDNSGVLWANVDVPMSSDAERARVVKYCSPAIDRFVESDGRDWGQVITHVAATNKPVQLGQTPVVQLSGTKRRGPIYLSINPTTGADTMADELFEETESTETEGGGGGDGGDGDSELKKAVACLADLGLILGDDTTMDNLCGRIVVAAETKKVADGIDTEEETDLGDEIQPEAVPAPAQSGVMMSKTVEALTAKVLAGEKADLVRRIKTLGKQGKITPAIQTKLASKLNGIKLSLNASGDVVDTIVHQQVAAYEELPANQIGTGRADRGVKLSNVRAVSAPEGSDKTDDELLAIWDGKHN